MLIRVMIWFIVIAGLAIGGLFLIGPQQIWQTVLGDPDAGRIELDQLQRSGRPNDALIGPADQLTIVPDAETPTFGIPAPALYARLVAAIQEEGVVTWVERDPVGLYARAITYSPRLRFADVNHIWVLPREGQTSAVILYSAAHMGYSDMGKNRERLDGWLQLLQDVPLAP